jgi:hypothetical protein
MPRTITVSIIDHPTMPDQWIAVVTNCYGKRYVTAWGDRPTVEEVEAAWREVRQQFKPYSPAEYEGSEPR